ncbi:MAG: acyl-CoA thioesterase II [Pseudomonadales bacterium]|jgi:acyl-CoA thioesterase-2|nr:acyl-CoA thioesterase II [Pseudomonadales bacterium]
MNPVLADIIDLLTVERIETNLYRGRNDARVPHVFGGQVLAQAIAAANATVDGGRDLHSMHAYFLRAGDWNRPVLYEVDRIRDGRSFTTRRVKAIQHGRAILSLSGSWQAPETGLSHAARMPDVPGPDGLALDRDRYARLAKRHPRVRGFAFRYDAIDSRQVEGFLMTDPTPRAPLKHTWMRTVDRLPDDPRLHQALLAYLSDMDFMSTSLLPHGATPAAGAAIQGASLDHSLWFHRPLRVDEWLLFAKESPTAGGARGFVRGSFFTEAGELVASAMQECLIRPRPDSAKGSDREPGSGADGEGGGASA